MHTTTFEKSTELQNQLPMTVRKLEKKNQIDLLQTMLRQFKLDDPKMRKLIEAQFSEYPKKGKQKEIPKEIIRRLRIQNKKLLEQVSLLKDQLKDNNADKTKIMNKLKTLIKLNNSLADALGSCPQCWGEDVECGNCSGNGVPGWRTINKRMFNLYVLPSLEKLYELNK